MGRAPCCDKVGLKKGPWTPDEDQKLVAYIQQHGHGSWRALPKLAGLLRCGKSCRLRWTNYLRPDIKRGRFAADEEQMIIQLHAILGNRWSAIATYLPGRTDNEIKNYWNTHLKKRLMHMGIDPVTHKPKADHVLEFPNAKPQLASELSHMAQWQSARLEAEARLAKQRHMQQQSSCIGNASSTQLPAHVNIANGNILPPSFSSSSSVLTAHTANSAAFAKHSIQSASSTSVTNENLVFRSAPTPGSLDYYCQALNSRRDFDSHAAQYYSNCSSSPFPPPPLVPSCSQLSSADPDVPFCAFSSVYSNRIPQLELEESDNFLQSCALAENSCSMSPANPLYHSLTGLLCPQELHVRSNANFLNLPANVSAFNAPTISSPFDYTNSTLMTDGGGSLYSSSSWGSMQQFQYSDHEHAEGYSSTPSVSMGGGECTSCTPAAGGESYNGPLEGLSNCNGVRQQTLSSPGSDLLEEEDTDEDQQVPQETSEGNLAVAQHLCPAAAGEDMGDIQVKEEDGDEVEQAEAERVEQDKQEGEEESSASEHQFCNDDAAEPCGAIASRPSVSIKEEEGKGASSAESSACTAPPRPPVSGSTHAVAAHNPFLEFLDFNQVPMLINWPACTGADNVGADYWSSFVMQQHTLHLKPTAGPQPPPLADPTSPRVSQT